MAAKKYLKLSGGKIVQGDSVVVSTGVSNDGDIPALDSTGRLDPSVMPVGVAADVKALVTTEDLDAGSYVNIYNDSGTEKARLADNASARDAHGFVKSAYTTGQTASVYFEGANDDLTGLTPGSRMYLGTAGAATSTPLDPTSGANDNKIHQFLGVATDANTINTDIDDCIVL